MGPVQVTNTFLKRLRRTGLLSDAQVDSVAADFNLYREPSPEVVAKVFVDRGLITSFQAEQIVSGQLRNLVIDDYELLDLLGAGGMGRVYIARNRQTGDRVALKTLTGRYQQDPSIRTRFRIEALAGMKINHRRVVRTLKMGRTEGVMGDIDYAVMELVEGINLLELVELHGPLPWSQACDIICQAAAGLQEAHKAGLIHRDVKPGNLLVDQDGEVKILDFGLAHHDAEGDEFSLSMIYGQNCVGTADYIAPEQAINSYKVDGRSDIYGLGCTLYFALTGQVPYSESSVIGKLRAHCTKQIRPLRELVPDAPPMLEKILAHMVAKNPDQRFKHAVALYLALKPFCRRQPVIFDFQKVLDARRRDAMQRSSIVQAAAAGRLSSSAESISHDETKPDASSGNKLGMQSSVNSPKASAAPSANQSGARTGRSDSSRQ